MVRSMNPDTTVEGGLAEPTELEPEQGSLDLADPEDRATVADWEAATAAVLRKSRRLTDEDPDSAVWDKLTRTTLDGIGITPLGTPQLLDALSTAGRPSRAGAWDVRAHLGAGPDRSRNEAALVDLDGGVTSLWVQVDADTDLAALLDGVLLDLAPRRAGRRGAGRRGAGLPLPGRGRPRSPPAPTWASSAAAARGRPRRGRHAGPRRRPAGCRRRRHRGARPGRLRRPGARPVAGRSASARLRVLTARRPRRRRGRGPGGVPLRRHRRAVPEHRQAARRAPAVGPGARAQRAPRRPRSASTWSPAGR